MSPTNPNEYVSEMKKDYKTFFTVCQTLTEAQALEPGVCGEWSVKAVVDHLTGWQVQSLPIIRTLLAEDKTDFDLDIDAFNQISVDDRHVLKWQESLNAFERSFKAFIEELEEIPESRFSTEAGLMTWVKAMIHEYKFHLPYIQRAQSS